MVMNRRDFLGSNALAVAGPIFRNDGGPASFGNIVRG